MVVCSATGRRFELLEGDLGAILCHWFLNVWIGVRKGGYRDCFAAQLLAILLLTDDVLMATGFARHEVVLEKLVLGLD